MMIKTLALGAALASLTIAGAALAQNAYDKDGIPNSSPTSPDTVNPMPDRTWSAPAPTQNTNLLENRNLAPDDQQARTPVSSDVAATLGLPVQIVTNGPVPDTAANRAKYGGPMSHAGKMTKPAGN